MCEKAKYLIPVLLLAFCACRKTPPPRIVPLAVAIQYPLLSKMILTTGGKTYTDTFTYVTSGTFKNMPTQLRSEIAGKLITFSYAQDIYMKVTLYLVKEYDINTSQLIDTYQYDGYQVLEPGIPPEPKLVTVTDANNKVIKTFNYFRVTNGYPPDSITFANNTVHLSYDSSNNLILYDTGNASTRITYTYDVQHNPLALMPADNEHLGYAVYTYPQTFVNNPLTISTGGTTKTYTYTYNQYGYSVSAKVSDGSTMQYEYIARH
jgi:YD repeat-containing protein